MSATNMPANAHAALSAGAEARPIIVVMGVSGAGKTTIGRALASRLGWAFEEGDDLHPTSSIALMHAGSPLTDADRQPWLEKVGAYLDKWRRAGRSGVITCSALKRSYRETLAQGRPEVRFVYLHADKGLIAGRLAARKGHFMPGSLLDSQFKVLEEPSFDEQAIWAEAGPPVDDIVAGILRNIAPAPPVGRTNTQAGKAPERPSLQRATEK